MFPANSNFQTCPDRCELPLAPKEIRDIRLLNGMSQARMAAALGVHQISTISDWENGVARPSADMERRIVRLVSKRWGFPLPIRKPGDGRWEGGAPRRDAADQWGRGPRIGVQ